MGWALMLDTLRNWCIAVQDPNADDLQFGIFADKACTVLGSIMTLPAPPPPEVLPSTVWEALQTALLSNGRLLTAPPRRPH